MRRVLYLNQLDDGASTVMIYRGKVGLGKLRQYGVQPPERVKILSNLNIEPKKHWQDDHEETFEFLPKEMNDE